MFRGPYRRNHRHHRPQPRGGPSQPLRPRQALDHLRRRPPFTTSVVPTPRPRALPPLDVLDLSATLRAPPPLALVTHLFYVPAAASSAEASAEMLSNVLIALSANSPRSSLRHVALQTGSMHYLPPLPLGGCRPPSPAPFREDAPRGSHSLFYYALEDILQATASHSQRLTWTVHRPSVILGASPRSEYNLLLTLAACAIICRRERAPLVYPGNEYTWRNPCCDASDAGLLAEQQIWSATEVVNEALNCTNGDVFSWGRLWEVVAEEFGVVHVAPGGEGWEWVERMKRKGDVWEAIVEEEGLVQTRLEEIANFEFVYAMTNMEFEMVSCMEKSRALGFDRRVDTMESLRRWIGTMRD
ncbi:hypothetical protein HPP92_013179 [Vanilla planifolia]|uniref:PRISE-like Rossmann-fold domain-containing protein n=1 Tax=Vanilla planifolia TaxID=51239 RepID=A0A835QRT6_VANPL|nr:hypothetical protein HPP92_013179 [Vanilla planifolia]